jgi:aspartate aminotransferase
MNKVADRLNKIQESQTIAMAKLSRELQDQGIDVINLSLGEPDFITPDNIRDAGKKAIDDGFTHYTPISGFQDLRKAICEKFRRENNIEFTPAQVVVSTGAKQSIANVVLSLVNPGDEVIVPTPYWVSYSQIIKLADGIPVFIDANIDTDFKISAEQLERSITAKTRMFIFSSPCNPTGSVYSKEELKKFAQVFAKHPQVLILSDEIYEHIRFIPEHHSLAEFPEISDRVIIVNGVSKGYAMTGWRIGYIAAPKWIAEACDKMQGQITSGTSSVSQKAALAAVSSEWGLYKDMQQSFRRRRDLVVSMMKEIKGLKVNDPQGAFYVFPDCSYFFGKTDGNTTINDCNDLCMYLLKDARISVVTGEAFGNNKCFRLSYATSDELLKKAIERMQASLAKLH